MKHIVSNLLLLQQGIWIEIENQLNAGMGFSFHKTSETRLMFSLIIPNIADAGSTTSH
jgi:hypothetical protein